MPKVPLRSLASNNKFAFPEMNPRAALSVLDEAAGYVWPEVEMAAQQGEAAVLLISAPGAMGKSAAGRALAGASGFAHLDLTDVRVGSGTLTGLIGKSLGMAAAGEYMGAIRAGVSGLILDGLDEAQLRAGIEHFLAFGEDVAELAEAAAPSTQIVLLGRPDSISGMRTVLEQRHISVRECTLLPLSRHGAFELIDATLDSTEYRIHRTARVPFCELRDSVINDLANALVRDRGAPDQWVEVGDFLGYPPVLQALASRLAVPNPKSELERAKVAGSAGRSSRGELLRSIVEVILDRESDKVKKNLASAIQLDEGDPFIRNLYTREEQVIRVLARKANRALAVAAPAGLPPAKHAIYEENISGFVIDHPFLRDRDVANAVFRDYLRSFASASDTIAAYGIDKQDLVALCDTPGPFFANFVHALTHGGTGIGAVSEFLVDDLLRSFSAEDAEDRYSIYSQTGDRAVLALYYSSGDVSGDEFSLRFDVTLDSGVVELTSPLSKCAIGSTGGIVLHGRSGLFEIGPSVILSASEIELHAERLVAFGGSSDRDGGGVLIAFESVSSAPNLQVASYPAEAIRVLGDALVHPWSPFKIELPTRVGLSSAKIRGAVVSTRRILSAFGRSARDEPARNREFVDSVIVGRSMAHRKVLDGLIEIGVVGLDGTLYRLDLGRLAEFGVSYSRLNGPAFEEALAPLVERVLDSKAFKE